MKYYAVKNGRKIGIFTSWDECRAQVDGFSGAQYKSFLSADMAKEYLAGGLKECTAEPESEHAVAYVDGSYNISTGEFAFGAVIFVGGEMMKFSEKSADGELAAMRNVAGEIKGAEFVISYCAEHGIGAIDIYYDYEGIAAWAEGRWKTNKAGTIAYKKLFDELSSQVSVRFVKVKGHSGDKYNDMADSLAKEAVGISVK